ARWQRSSTPPARRLPPVDPPLLRGRDEPADEHHATASVFVFLFARCPPSSLLSRSPSCPHPWLTKAPSRPLWKRSSPSASAGVSSFPPARFTADSTASGTTAPSERSSRTTFATRGGSRPSKARRSARTGGR